MIETGQFDEELGECSTFCFECFCFPCGCSFCKCSICESGHKHKEEDAEIKRQWGLIELPEIIGRIKPTEIAQEPEPDIPPPLIIIQHSNDKETEQKQNDNPYDVYNLSFSDDFEKS